jgi:hypothetical protein
VSNATFEVGTAKDYPAANLDFSNILRLST